MVFSTINNEFSNAKKFKPAKPPIPNIQNASPAIGSRVKVWFDKPSKDLLIESETGAITRDIYGICLEDVLFDTETTARENIQTLLRSTMSRAEMRAWLRR
ncbi:hypothetical protein [Mesorhizobium sp. L-2-11]|uniref:hypothetical protein n=1 Tax=Mesorhizobium sp. L-2-11 TaxID=2744521 RepID=UPI001925FE57|nr:hypothetical protein [Mesorhizobium sp. L-2-11]BCH19613.1 hypothetical protein MesoLjLa_64640 [Mesorhizobium sp. L-2-11]